MQPYSDPFPPRVNVRDSRCKKLRVMMDWTPDLLFAREIEQLITVRDDQALMARMRAHTNRRSEERIRDSAIAITQDAGRTSA